MSLESIVFLCDERMAKGSEYPHFIHYFLISLFYSPQKQKSSMTLSPGTLPRYISPSFRDSARTVLSLVIAIAAAGIPLILQAQDAFASSGAATGQGSSYANAWGNAATFLFNDANEAFHVPGPAGTERERALGAAITLLNVQPRTTGNLVQTRKEFERLSSGTINDEEAIFAQFFLARLHAHYECPGASPAEAKRLYRGLLKNHPGSPVAEYSASALALIELYDDIPSAERTARFASLETLLPGLKTSSGLRDFHLTMGYAYIDFQPEHANAKAMEHLIAADGEGITRWQSESEAWVAIGELAKAEGHTDIATTYYGKFLAKYKRDNRHYSIQKRLESLAIPKS